MGLTQYIHDTGIHKVFSPLYSGIGHVLMFHRVYNTNEHIFTRGTTISQSYLENTIQYFLKNNIDIISLDEVYQRLTTNSKPRRFAAFTFDDGYLDNLTHAYPVFKKYNLPFAIYLITDFPGHKAVLWWYLLEDLVIKRSLIEFSFEDQKYQFTCDNTEEKYKVFRKIRRLILNCHTLQLQPFLQAIFEKYDYDLFELTKKLSLSWEQVAELNKDPNVTIGSHTKSHIALNRLDQHEIKEEILGANKLITEKTGSLVEHFAYPFGSENEVTKREFDITRQLGFKTVFTTRSGNLFRKHKNYMECLPRIDTREELDNVKLDLFVNGFTPCIKNRLKRIVTT